ncbi:hypothetical protein LguiB_033897 [Lonicera macranthoides]
MNFAVHIFGAKFILQSIFYCNVNFAIHICSAKFILQSIFHCNIHIFCANFIKRG